MLFLFLFVFLMCVLIRHNKKKKKTLNLLTIGGAKFLLNRFTRCFGKISCLNIFLYTDKWFFQGIERAGVQHLLLNLKFKEKNLEINFIFLKEIENKVIYLSGIWAPWHKEQFLFLWTFSCTLALMHVFKIKKTISGKRLKK